LRDRLIPSISTANIFNEVVDEPLIREDKCVKRRSKLNKMKQHERANTEGNNDMFLRKLFERKFNEIPMPANVILKGIHFNYRLKATTLLNKLSKIDQNQFRWNAMGSVFINGKKIPNSNMKFIMANLF